MKLPFVCICLIYSILAVTYSCNNNTTTVKSKEQNISDISKRNQNWVWFINEKTGKGEWLQKGKHSQQRTGEYTYFYWNGVIMQNGKIRDNKRYDTIYHYDLEGKLFGREIILPDSTINIYREGPYKLHFETGEIYETGVIKNNNHDSIWTKFYKNGNKESESKYINGIRTDTAFWWYESGNIEHIEVFSNGKANGLTATYFENGKLEQEIFYKNGLMNGKCTSWYETGIRKNEAEFVNGLQQGKLSAWYASGKIKKVEYYVNDKLEGHCVYYYENGQKHEEGNFINGKPTGTWSGWEENGKLIKTVKL